MVNGAKVALAVGAGYFLGRSRKMRLALMLAAAGMTGKFPTSPSALAAQGLKSLGASADVGQLTQQLRGEVLNAARAAALAAATKQVDALNDRLQGVTSAVGADEVLEDVGDTVGGVGDTIGVGEPVRSVGRLGRRRSAEQDDDQGYDEEPLDVEEDVDDEDRESDDTDFDEDEDASPVDEEDDEDDTSALDEEDMDEDEPADDDRPARSGRRATRQATGPSTSGRRSSRAGSDDGPRAAGSRRATRTATKSAPVRRGR